jgi:adenylate kinase
MRLIIFGPPGSGKGTYASRIASQLGIPHISTGDLLREVAKRQDEVGKEVAEHLKKGELVPDEIVIGLLKERLEESNCEHGFILDGYPRTFAQVKALSEIAKVDAVINLRVPKHVIMERLSGRRTCRKCASIYHIKFLKPKKPGVCDRCGGELYQRKDDTPKVIEERLRIYEEQIKPLLKLYKGSVKDVECEKADIPPEEVVARIYKTLGMEK